MPGIWSGRSGGYELGKSRSFGMKVRERRRLARPCPSMASAKDLRPKKSAACRRTGGRCARSGKGAIADRPCRAHPSTSHRLTCHQGPRRRATTRPQGREPTGGLHDHQPDHETEAANPKLPSTAPAASSAAASLPRRALGRPAFSLRSDMLFDQGRACGEDRGKGEKQAANDWAEAGRDKADYGHRPPSRNLTRYSYQRV